jgi:hypothetical protein
MNHLKFGSAIMRGEIYDTVGIKMSHCLVGRVAEHVWVGVGRVLPVGWGKRAHG